MRDSLTLLNCYPLCISLCIQPTTNANGICGWGLQILYCKIGTFHSTLVTFIQFESMDTVSSWTHPNRAIQSNCFIGLRDQFLLIKQIAHTVESRKNDWKVYVEWKVALFAFVNNKFNLNWTKWLIATKPRTTNKMCKKNSVSVVNA